jgi:hypothetical protein
MKSKNKIFVTIFSTLLFFSVLIDIGLAERPKTQANGIYELVIEVDKYYEFYCTEMDSTELNNVYGADWATDLGSWFWFTGSSAPANIGEKTRIYVEAITNTSTIWQFQIDGWDWTAKTSTYGAPSVNDVIYSLPFNASSAFFNPSVWIVTSQASSYLAEMSIPMGFTSFENEIYYNSSDVDDYQIGWIFDEETGVVMNWWIKNGVGDTIFEMWGLELKLQVDESYNWIVTTFNQDQLSNTFGSNWELDINAYCWWTLDSPIISGEKSMFYVDAIGNHPSIDDWYWFDIDGWNWKAKDLLHGGVPDRDDGPYALPMDPESFSFTYSLFIIPTPVERYLDAVSYSAGYTHDGNEVTRATSDDEAYTAIWTFDEELGVVDSFQIKNSGGTTIFHIILMEYKLDPGTSFEWEVTELNEAGLEAVLDTDWETNIQSDFGSGCNELGAKMKKQFDGGVELLGDLWYLEHSEWDWTMGSFAVDPDLTSSSYGVYCNPEGNFWGTWMWFVPFPADYYLIGRLYNTPFELNYLTVTYNRTDLQDYQTVYTYDLIFGVFDTVQILDNESTVVFEYQLVTAELPPGGGIPGYDTLIMVSSVFLMIGLISVISIRKKFKN